MKQRGRIPGSPGRKHPKPVGTDMQIDAEPLDPETFRPFGTVLEPGTGTVKTLRDGAVRLTRPGAGLPHDATAETPAVEFYDCAPATAPLVATHVEHHPHSTQLFACMSGTRWLVVVWPGAPGTDPRAFVARPDQAVLYAPGIWHHGIVALDRPAQFISWMWRTGGETDTVFAVLPAPVHVGWPQPVAA